MAARRTRKPVQIRRFSAGMRSANRPLPYRALGILSGIFMMGLGTCVGLAVTPADNTVSGTTLPGTPTSKSSFQVQVATQPVSGEWLQLPSSAENSPANPVVEPENSTPQPRVVSLPAPAAPTAREMLRAYPAAMQQVLGAAHLSEGQSTRQAVDALLEGDLLSGDLFSSEALDRHAQPPGPLESIGPSAPSVIPGAGHGTDAPSRTGLADGEDPHAEVFAENCYPSAVTCAKCHQKIYDEWRVSAHAYAAISPMFQKFEQAITQLSQGTIGTFCMRCHAPVATQLNYPRQESIVDAPYVYREGITCVACHRVKEAYGRVNGERRIEPGPIQAPVYSASIGGDGVAKAIAEKDIFKIKVDPNDKGPGQQIHLRGIEFEQFEWQCIPESLWRLFGHSIEQGQLAKRV